ncbi:hypothetical protein A3J23_00320 [Candidatus Peregrinibacteria bacterium RIFCSPLOWO2_02_FULL_48_14]|nr:MAG: hypothetical protein A3J23_00320 [Candidatus Peregrinibacteria bacterium RIFCSPLOWO2_02_FULL_48_14]
MAQFQYTAVNNGGKKLSGLIGAATEEEARKQLNTFGISLLAIQKMAETAAQSVTQEAGTSDVLPKFEFEAFDKIGKKVLGTIPASNRYKAFKRLMDEYQFEVSYVVAAGATEEEKVKAKAEDLSALKAEYEAQNKVTDKEVIEEQKISTEFETQRKNLLQKVDFILEKIKGLLASYLNELTPESRKLIQGYIDKLLRIKSSTNLDYIQSTSEELLKKIQDQELFLHKEKMQSQRDTLKLESQKMMASLHERPVQLEGVAEKIEELQSKLGSSENPLFQGLANWLALFTPTPEEKELKTKIATVSRQIWTYRKIVWTTPAGAKEEARQSLNSLMEEKTRLKQELKNRIAARKRKSTNEEVPEPLITEEVNHFLSWLLAFYLAAYFVSYYSSAKVLPGGSPLPGDFNLLSSPLLRHILISVFLWHVILSLRLNTLRYKPWANWLVLPLGLVLNAGLVFNL